MPAGDVLIHCGDVSLFSKSLRQIEDFNDWLGTLPHRWKLVIPGNHEFFLEASRCNALLSNTDHRAVATQVPAKQGVRSRQQHISWLIKFST